MLTRRTLLLSAAAGATTPLAHAQRSDTLRIVVPFTPGTTPDTLARALTPQLQARLGLSPVTDNRPGASGMIGMGAVAKTTDMNTVMVVTSTTTTLPLFYKQVDFDVINGFSPITQLCSSSFVLAVHKDVPASNLDEFTRWAQANPGQFYASPGPGTHHHLFMELLLQTMGLKLQHVPYKGAAPAITDLLGGQVPTMFLPIQAAVPLREQGRIRIVGSSLRQRHPAFPQIPSLAEQGARNYHGDPWFSVWGPPRMPAAQVEQLRAAFVAGLADPALKDTLTQQGLIIETSTPADLLAHTRAESALWTRVVREANIKPE
jgi:tripartite-type tricarboxylate transporter receptor subunit TctC